MQLGGSGQEGEFGRKSEICTLKSLGSSIPYRSGAFPYRSVSRVLRPYLQAVVSTHKDVPARAAQAGSTSGVVAYHLAYETSYTL